MSRIARRPLRGNAARPTAPTWPPSPSGPAARRGRRTRRDVDRILLRRYLAFLATRRYARASVARKAAALPCLLLVVPAPRALIEVDPARRLSAPEANGRLPRVLSHQELDRLLDPHAARAAGTTRAERGAELRDDAVLELLYAAGLRVAELCGLDRARPRPRGAGSVTVTGKGNKERRVPIHDRAAEALRRLADAGPGGAGRVRTAPPRPSS